ncbi:hypothetical protein [Bradymonas sediminis]|uniref:hypothetical protein n=1 Tax=Bradymonas sediminis TaxID=1548548 RepID=UPI00105D12B9|nr:hypothetical protein [Bradymonas sediminis]TDP75818.1 hypothetical protein DFR33_103165 [Bradymonas sediminis]
MTIQTLARSTSILRASLLATSLLLGTTGCDANPGAPEASAPVDTSDCTPRAPNAADQAGEADPRVLRGVVHAPFGKLAAYQPAHAPALPARSPFPDWLVGTAEAAPLDTERTVPEATVHLYKIDARGARTGENIAETTSDYGGNWCIRLPEGVSPGPGLMVEARAADGATRLRRSVVAPFAGDTFVGTEALTRLLQANNVDFLRISTETYINMESIADTRMDLLDPVVLTPQTNVEDAVEQIRSRLATDPRLLEKIEKTPKTK